LVLGEGRDKQNDQDRYVFLWCVHNFSQRWTAIDRFAQGVKNPPQNGKAKLKLQYEPGALPTLSRRLSNEPGHFDT
jgi:hypothetical protein